MRNNQTLPATLRIMAAASLWGLIGPIAVWAAREGLTAGQTAFWRTALTALPFAVLALRTGARPRPASFLGPAVFGVVGIAVMYVSFFMAVQRTGVGIAAVLLYTGPAWVAAWQWTSERRMPGSASIVALLLTIGGIVLVSYVPAGAPRLDRLGVLMGLLSGISYSTHFTLGRAQVLRHGAPLAYAVAMAAATLAIAPLAQPSWPALSAWPPLLLLSLFATFIASLLFARGVVAVTPVRASITATIEPVVAMAASMLIFGSVLRWQQMLGAALVLTGVTLIIVRGVGAET